MPTANRPRSAPDSSHSPTPENPSGTPRPRWSRRGVLAGGATGLAAAVAGWAGPASGSTPRLGAAARPTDVAVVVRNGRVYAGPGLRSGQEAIALDRAGRIVGLGTDADVRRLATRRTELIDARGGTIMSGLVDGHMHPLGAASRSLNPSLENGTFTVPQLQEVLGGFLADSADQEPDGWLTVADWSPVGILPSGTSPDRAILDALATKRPIVLAGSDGHNSFVNTRALELAGITDKTPNPPAGEIVRDAAGRATGLLKDDAQGLVTRHIPPPTKQAIFTAYRAVIDFLLSCGVTSFLDAACGEDELKAYADLKDRGWLPQRVTPALVVGSQLARRPRAAAAYADRLRRRYADAGLDLTTIKVFMDGVIEHPAQTAALLKPYLDDDGRATDNRGDLYVSDPDFRQLAVALDRAGWQIHTHALGDRAVRVALNGFAAARADRGSRRPDPRHTAAHLQLVHPDDYPRFAQLGVLACMQLQWAVRDEWTVEALRPYIGRERFRRMYPAGSLARAGAQLVGGSDWPVDPFDAMNQLATAVSRQGFGRKPLNPDQALTRRAALAMHTRGSAYQLHGGRAGLLEVGNRADVVVVDTDLTQAGPRGTRKAKVQQTVIGGRVAFDARDAKAPRRTPALARLGGGRPHADCGHD